MSRRLATVVLASLTLCGCTYTISEETVFVPPRVDSRAASPSEMAIRNEAALHADVRHDLIAYSRGRLAVTHVSRVGEGPPRPLFIVCMGNASDRIRHGATYADRLLPFGDVLLFDYPGYGDSTGSPSVDNLLAAGPSLAKYADDLARGRPVILWGHSLGGFVCSQMAGFVAGLAAVALETTAANAGEVASAWKPWYLPFLRLEVSDGLERFDTPSRWLSLTGQSLFWGPGAILFCRCLCTAPWHEGSRRLGKPSPISSIRPRRIMTCRRNRSLRQTYSTSCHPRSTRAHRSPHSSGIANRGPVPSAPARSPGL